jgi:integral membrane sensor domain MASE1
MSLTTQWNKIKENLKKQHLIVQVFFIILIISVILMILMHFGVKFPISYYYLELLLWISVIICSFGSILGQLKVEK